MRGSQDAAPKSAETLLKETDATGRQKIVQQMSINLIPIMEKGLLDPVIVHGCVPVSLALQFRPLCICGAVHVQGNTLQSR